MTAHIYIIKDGNKTKIGKSINLDSRLKAYNTHNPNHEIYKSYSCTADEAHKIELVIKQFFKDKQTGQGKEWFEVPAHTIASIVLALLDANSIATPNDAMPSLQGLELTKEAQALLDNIHEAIERKKPTIQLKEQFAELFAKAFKLGTPYHKLPEDVLCREYLRVDLNHCNKDSKLVHEAVKSHLRFPYSDHNYYFFHIFNLSSGYSFAICTAEVSMPYLEAIDCTAKRKILDNAKELGLYSTFHDNWSWHHPSETALVLYQPKTSVSFLVRQWDKSFRKWVIERQVLLKQEEYESESDLGNVIQFIADDSTFPLAFNDYNDLQESYLGPFFHYLSNNNMEDTDWEDNKAKAMQLLIKLWKSQ